MIRSKPQKKENVESEERRAKSESEERGVKVTSRLLTPLRPPRLLGPLLAPELLEPLVALSAGPASSKMHEQIAIAPAHVVAALDVGVEFALGVHAHVVAHDRVLEHEVLDSVLLSAEVVRAHEHRVVGHSFKQIAGKRCAAEKGAAGVDSLVILGDENVDILDADVVRGVNICRVLLKLAIEDWRVAHDALLDSGRGQNLLDEIVLGRHEDDVRVDEPDPLGVGVQVECFCDGGDLGPGLWVAELVRRCAAAIPCAQHS